jgi:hypothetical protein
VMKCLQIFPGRRNTGRGRAGTFRLVKGATDNGDTVFALRRGENQPFGAGGNAFSL